MKLGPLGHWPPPESDAVVNIGKFSDVKAGAGNAEVVDASRLGDMLDFLKKAAPSSIEAGADENLYRGVVKTLEQLQSSLSPEYDVQRAGRQKHAADVLLECVRLTKFVSKGRLAEVVARSGDRSANLLHGLAY